MLKYICLSFFYFVCAVSSAQTDNLNQFWNQYDFTRDLSQNWVLQGDAGFVSSSTPDDPNMFHGITQYYLRGWIHYYAFEKWKFSAFISNYSNKNVPELNQKQAREFRTALQATYSLYQSAAVKINLRARFEDRHMQTDENYMEAVERLRFQVKAVCPLSTLGVKVKKMYVFASDELFFKTKSQVSGPEVFDRNRAMVGCGFAFSEDIKIEAAYANEIMPRSGTDKLVNAFQVKGVFNNIFSHLLKPFKRKKNEVDQGEGDL
ncbi:Protein of unknown function [Flavobacterium aquidurense]|uniref:DUF2490 domain-containing protein n=1 Tax=Flavobacterium frigidimaris TaxID=262320 RepID=A0ABX4BVB1_FLAFR|nr:DUF2490 domain-containing protein [Flavobacterium frigidimaris]OXA82025.1 hypothetical protein B0A65_01295 [Flavobacterium frigidimaris]SDY56846.1 Protein of unknown function [Flavobacterium aquidurense]